MHVLLLGKYQLTLLPTCSLSTKVVVNRLQPCVLSYYVVLRTAI